MGYKNYGIAEHLDFILMNSYFRNVTNEELEEFHAYGEENPQLNLPPHEV